MDQHTISSIMFCSSIKCLQGGCHASWLQTCWCLPGTFETLWSRRWWLSRKNCYGWWNLGPLPPAGNQESEQGMAPYLLTKTEELPHTTICGKGYAGCLLGWTSSSFGALHAQGEHCDQCNVCRAPKESPASCNQVQTTWTSEYRCFAPTWQCSAPFCPFSCYNNPDLSFERLPHPPYSPDLAPPVTYMSLDRSKRRWESSFTGPTIRCSRRCTSGCALSQKNFCLEVSMHFRSAGTLVWNAVETT